MCSGCFEEYGRPEPDDTARAAVPLIAAVYDESDVGGNLHIILDDWNIEDEHVAYCTSHPNLTAAEKVCIAAFSGMSLDQRAAALAVYEGLEA